MTTYDDVQTLVRLVNQEAGGWGNEGALVNRAGWKGPKAAMIPEREWPFRP